MRYKKLLKNIAQKTIAVSSGKGGVGKTVTSVNLALYYAKRNLRVGLIDLDPLSDITTLLDLSEAENILNDDQENNKKESFKNYAVNAFGNLDILLPLAKLRKDQSKEILKKLYKNYSEIIHKNYDILIFDLPAGIRYEDNLVFLNYANTLVIVTNAEPAAHVSAGGYIKSVLEIKPKLAIYLWHNKYIKYPDSDFDPLDVIGNYNKNVAKEVKLDDLARRKINNLAIIPKDAAMDLLQTNPSVRINIQRCLLDLAEFIHEQRLDDFRKELAISEKSYNLLKYYLIHTRHIENTESYLNELGNYLKRVLINKLSKIINQNKANLQITDINIFTRSEKTKIAAYLKKIKNDQIIGLTVKLIEYLEKGLKISEESAAIQASASNINIHKAIDKQIGKLLMYINAMKGELSISLVNTACIYVFYFSLYKLFQSKTILKIINDFIPKKKNKRGVVVRDRFKQIHNLVEKDENYKQNYFNLIKTLYPVLNKQIMMVMATFNLQNLMLRDCDNRINKLAYLKLFSNFIHETIHSGLGIIIGFIHRPAAEAFKKAANKLLEKMAVN